MSISHTTIYKSVRRFLADNLSMRSGFCGDQRGVSALVGAILLLGILVIALSSYQAVIVPQQNAQTEFSHNQQVEDEMVDFRNTLYEARLDNRKGTTSVNLGTQYQSRTLAINPPPASGTLQSTDQTNMVVRENGPDGDVVLNLMGTQFFEYTPSYSEYRDAGTIRYEHTLLYHEFDSDYIALSNQRLVRGDAITLITTESKLDERGVGTATYEPKPSRFRVLTVEDPVITLPTELSEEDWEEILAGKVDPANVEVSNDELTLTFEEEKRIRYTPVTDQEDLPEDERDDETDEGDDDDAETEVNPAGEGALQFVGADFDDEEAIVTFRNSGGLTRNITDARIPFYFAERQGNIPEEVESIYADDTNAASNTNRLDNDLVIRANFEKLDPSILVPGNANSFDITFEFDEQPRRQDFFVLTLRFDSGDRSTYFISGAELGATPQLTNLDIAGQGDDATISEGDDEDISVDIENVGEEEGTFEIILEIVNQEENDVVEDFEQEITLDGGDTETVTFESVTGEDEFSEGEYAVVVTTEFEEISGSLTVEADEDHSAESILESVVATANTPQGQQAGSVDFDYQISESRNLELRIRNQEGGNIIGSSTVANPELDGNTNVNINSGGQAGGDRQNYPIWVDVEVSDTGETCAGELTEGDDPTELCN